VTHNERWRAYRAKPESTVVGRLLVSEPLPAPELGRSVELLAWLPAPDLGPIRRVVYMHDGQNLFDESASHAGEWNVDETMTALGTPCAVVGITNAGDDRWIEYRPWPFVSGEPAAGVAYGRFVVESVVPFVESTLPVSIGADGRGVMGSSLGALISLYLFLEYPDDFGFVGAMSSAAWYQPDDGLWSYLRRSHRTAGRVYLDVGTNEIPDDDEHNRAYLDVYRRLVSWFGDRGFRDGRLMAVEDEDAIHHETAWSRRLPDALRFLLA
jgi:predicted alpha/beta superfamily hydrolase